MGEFVGVLFEDEFEAIDPRLHSLLEQMPTLQVILEEDLDQAEPYNKVAIISVQKLRIAGAVARIGALKERLPTLRILVAFQALNAADLSLLLEAGADAFVTPSASSDELSAAVTALLHGEDLLGKGSASAHAAPVEADLNLTRREAEILRFLSSGFSNKDVARALNLSVRTVETHRLNLRHKTRTGRLSDLVSLARRLRLDPVLGVERSKDRRCAK